MIRIPQQKSLVEYETKKDKRKVRKIKEQKKSGRINKKQVKKTIKKIQEKKVKKKSIKKPVKKPIKKQIKKKKKKVAEKKKRSPRKTTNVFNAGSYIRKKTKMKVSPGFVDEEISRIKDQLDIDISESEQIAKAMGMRTLMEVHAIRVYDYRTPDRNTIITCDGCGNSFVVCVEKASKKLICPFCGQKRYIKIA